MNAGAKGISFINHIPSKTSLSGALMFSNLSLSLPIRVVNGLIRTCH